MRHRQFRVAFVVYHHGLTPTAGHYQAALSLLAALLRQVGIFKFATMIALPETLGLLTSEIYNALDIWRAWFGISLPSVRNFKCMRSGLPKRNAATLSVIDRPSREERRLRHHSFCATLLSLSSPSLTLSLTLPHLLMSCAFCHREAYIRHFDCF